MDPDQRQAETGRRFCHVGGPESGDGQGGAGPQVRADRPRSQRERLRGFYDFHSDAGSGPMVNPFPLARRGGRAHAHHNPMDLYRNERSGLYRPRHVQRVPRSIPDEKFNELFAQLGSHRDRALVAFWVSTGARAS
jgi:integrase